MQNRNTQQVDTMLKRLFPLLSLALLAGAVRAADPPAVFNVVPILKATTSWDGTPLHYPEGQTEITGIEISLPPGAETGWHTHPAPSFGFVLEGEWTVSLKDGRTKTLHKGESVAEVVDTPHNGRNTGSTTARFLVFYAGAVGQTLSQKLPPPTLP